MTYSVDALRRELRKQRRALGFTHQCRASRLLLKAFENLNEFHCSHRVAFYLPNDGELDCRPLIKLSWSLGKCCYLPVLSRSELGPTLKFSLYLPGSVLEKNIYGIPEPVTKHTLKAQELDMVLVPLVGYDDMGNRMGMGAGYYDRTFAKLRGTAKPSLIGIAHRCQQVTTILIQPWDIPMHKIIAV